MEDNKNNAINKEVSFNEEHTMKLDLNDIRAIPMVCSWCNSIYKIDEWSVNDGQRTGVSHGLCPKCYEKMTKDLPPVEIKEEKMTDSKRAIKFKLKDKIKKFSFSRNKK